jgi:hypothetical protein
MTQALVAAGRAHSVAKPQTLGSRTQAYSVGPQELRLQSSQLRDVCRQLVRLKGEACV